LKFSKKNEHGSYRSNRRTNFVKKNSSLSSNKSRPRGNVPQLYEKYMLLAKEASSTGDRIQSEYYLQFADHYSRIMIQNDNKFSYNEKKIEINNKSSEDDEKTLRNYKKTEYNQPDQKIEKQNDSDLEEKSIEAVPFIAEPPKNN
tara:strand:- start:57 stop:491 length:435 start_codon:yes stop_codon:yes gene_type:complete